MDVTPVGVANQLAVSSLPASVNAGASFGLVVVAEDNFGTADKSYNGSVTLSMADNPEATSLGGRSRSRRSTVSPLSPA